MASAVLTSKGQVTLPMEMRKQLNLHAGDRLEFIRNVDTGKYEIHPRKRSVMSLIGMLPKPEKAATIKELNETIRMRGATAG